MGHFRSDLRDIEFNLFEVFGLGDRLGRAPFDDLDAEGVRDILAEASRLCEGPVAESFQHADRHPPVFDPETSTVTMPERVRRSYQAWTDGGFHRAALSPEAGGHGVPSSVAWAINELSSGANFIVHSVAIGAWFADLLRRIGNVDQRRFAELALERGWGSTMVLTEPEAGSDVGAGRTKAVEQHDGTWHIEGVKRFITGGEHDLAENIFHLVLARPEGAAPGTKGLSLFLVPKFLVDLETGELLRRNGVRATNLESKMGLKGSPTCEMTFGDRPGEPAVGYLVGDVHDGIRQMFLVIEHARMSVGAKAVGTLSSGYLHALDYAKTRIQGPDLTRMTDKSAPRVPIIRHPDVRRSLLTQKAYAEGLRALLQFAALQQDEVALTRARGESPDRAAAMSDLLLPILKALSSERAWTVLGTETLQTLGGSGFLSDHPIEQYVRDTKIDTLYEGTTAIQGNDFFFRKILFDPDDTLAVLLGQMDETLASTQHPLAQQAAAEALRQGLDDVRAMVATMRDWADLSRESPTEIYLVGLNASRLLLAVGDLLVGWLLVRQAQVAADSLGDTRLRDADRHFYLGKVAVAEHFATTVLPRLSSDRTAMATATQGPMELPDEAF